MKDYQVIFMVNNCHRRIYVEAANRKEATEKAKAIIKKRGYVSATYICTIIDL